MQISLKAARVNANLTQQEVSQMMGISKSTLIKWEKGQTSPNYFQLVKLCRIYAITIDDIFLQEKST